MWPHHTTQKDHYPPLSPYEQETGIDTLWEDQSQLTQQYRQRAVASIEKNQHHSFFLYPCQWPRSDGCPLRHEMADLTEVALYYLEDDVAEMNDVANEHPEVVARLLGHAATARTDTGDQLLDIKGTGTREPGRVAATSGL